MREEVSFAVPASKCGIVIGRGGETIKLINQQSGAFCEMDRSAINPPNGMLKFAICIRNKCALDCDCKMMMTLVRDVALKKKTIQSFKDCHFEVTIK